MRKSPSGLAKLAGILSLGLASLLPSCNTFECSAPQNIPNSAYSSAPEHQKRLYQLKNEALQLARGMNRLSNKNLEKRIFVPENHGMDFLTPLFQKISSHPRIEYDDDRTSIWIRNRYAEIGKITCQIDYQDGRIKEIFLVNPTSVVGLKRTGNFYIGKVIDITDKENLRDLGDYVFEEKELQPLIAEMEKLRARLPKENPRKKEREERFKYLSPKLTDEELRELLLRKGLLLQRGNDLKKKR